MQTKYINQREKDKLLKNILDHDELNDNDTSQ